MTLHVKCSFYSQYSYSELLTAIMLNRGFNLHNEKPQEFPLVFTSARPGPGPSLTSLSEIEKPERSELAGWAQHFSPDLSTCFQSSRTPEPASYRPQTSEPQYYQHYLNIIEKPMKIPGHFYSVLFQPSCIFRTVFRLVSLGKSN